MAGLKLAQVYAQMDIRGMADVNKGLNQMRGRLNSVKTLIGTIVTGYGVTKIGKAFLDAAVDVENYQKRLNAVVKDTAKAKKLFKDINHWAAINPVDTSDAIASFVRLKSAAVDNAKEALNSVGDLASVMGVKMVDVAGAIVSTETEPLRRLGIVVDRTGKKAIIQSGNVKIAVAKDIDSVRRGILEVIQKNFAGAMDSMKNTWTGTMNTMRGMWTVFKQEVMGSAEENGPFGRIRATVIKIREEWEAWVGSDSYKEFIQGMQVAFVGVGNMILGFVEMINRSIAGWASIRGAMGLSEAKSTNRHKIDVEIAEETAEYTREKSAIWKKKGSLWFNGDQKGEREALDARLEELNRKIKLVEINKRIKLSEMNDASRREHMGASESLLQVSDGIRKFREMLKKAVVEAVSEGVDSGLNGASGTGGSGSGSVPGLGVEMTKAGKAAAQYYSAMSAAWKEGVVSDLEKQTAGLGTEMTKAGKAAAQYYEAQSKAQKKDIVRGLTEDLKDLNVLTEQWVKDFQSGIAGVIVGARNLKDMLADLAREMANMLVKFALFGEDGKSGAFGGWLSNLFKKEADGDVFLNGRVLPFADGTVIDRPMLFPMASGGVGLMGEAGAEAIMPLKRLPNGKLGVESSGGSGMAITNNINVTVDGGSGDSAQDEVFARKIGTQVSDLIDQKMAEFTQRQMRPGGMLNPVF